MTEKKPIGARPTLEERLDEVVRECVKEVVQNAKQIVESGSLTPSETPQTQERSK